MSPRSLLILTTSIQIHFDSPRRNTLLFNLQKALKVVNEYLYIFVRIYILCLIVFLWKI